MSQFDRRKFLITGAAVLGASGVAAGIGWWYRARRMPSAAMETDAHAAGEFPNALRVPGSSGVLGVLDVSAPLTIAAKSVQHAILEGKTAPLLVYQVEQAGTTWINPVFRVRSGATVRAKLQNALDENTIIHWHGFKVDARNDAHPLYEIGAGAAYDYEFPVPIGTDGGLLERPYPVKEAFLAPGERLDVLLDLSGATVGDAVTLQSLAFDPMHAEGSMAVAPSPHAGMAMDGLAPGAPAAAAHGAMLGDGSAIDLLRVNVTRKEAYEQRVPAALSTLSPVKAGDAQPRTFLLDLKNGRWRVNGETFEMKKTNVTVQRGAREIWEIRNDKASMTVHNRCECKTAAKLTLTVPTRCNDA